MKKILSGNMVRSLALLMTTVIMFNVFSISNVQASEESAYDYNIKEKIDSLLTASLDWIADSQNKDGSWGETPIIK